MDFPKNTLSVFYIEDNTAFFYGSNIPTVLKVDFPEDIVSDLEVLSREKLSIFIQTFLESNSIPPSNVIILLSPNLTYEKDFLKTSLGQETDKETQSFLDYVPFESVLSKIFKLSEKTKIVASNKEFCDILKSSFEKQKFYVIGVVSLSILQEAIPELSRSLNLQIVLNKIDLVKNYNLYKIEETKIKNPPKESKNPKNKNLYILLSIFGFLFVILIVVFQNFR